MIQTTVYQKGFCNISDLRMHKLIHLSISYVDYYMMAVTLISSICIIFDNIILSFIILITIQF